LERVCAREKWAGGGKEMVRKKKECPLDGGPHADQNMMLANLTCFAFVYVVY